MSDGQTSIDMYRELAKVFAKKESRYKEALDEDEIYHLLKDGEYIIIGKQEETNNPCFTGDTMVATADGRGYVSFKQLVEEGKDVEVYSESDNKVITIKTMRNSRVTAKQQKIFKITFTSGESIRATANHKFYLLNNQKVELKDLQKGQQLRSFTKYKNSKGSGILNRDSKMFGDLPHFTVNSIKEDGIEDVYNGTVDQYHNYFVGNFKGKTEHYTRLGSSVKVANCGEVEIPDSKKQYLILNLYSYVSNKFKDNAVFEDNLFIHHVNCAVRLLDSCLPVCDKDRNIKLSMAGLSDMMAALGVKYNSDEGVLFIEKLQQLICTTAYESSIEVAKERGSYINYHSMMLKKDTFLKRIFNNKKNELITRTVKTDLRNYGLRNRSIFYQGTVFNDLPVCFGIRPLSIPWWYSDRTSVVLKFHKPFIDYFAQTEGISFEDAKSFLEKQTKETCNLILSKSPWGGSLNSDITQEFQDEVLKRLQPWVDHNIVN